MKQESVKRQPREISNVNARNAKRTLVSFAASPRGKKGFLGGKKGDMSGIILPVGPVCKGCKGQKNKKDNVVREAQKRRRNI